MRFPELYLGPQWWLPLLCLFGVAFLPSDAPRWGSDAHGLINRSATTHLPADFRPFAQWADDLDRLATEADARKCCDPGEAIKHYIDIDDYPEFFSGQLPRTYAEMVAKYGQSRVDGNGTVPWAIEASYAELVQHFVNGDWEGAVAAAADIGHYVGDFHNPLHLTLNYNGQLTGQNGIHRRYESNMTAQHLDELEPAPSTVDAITEPLAAVFQWIDIQYPGVALILAADSAARAATGGNTSSSAYYGVLWDETGEETKSWVRSASLAVASLWYSAWIEAGSPRLPGTATNRDTNLGFAATQVLPSAPNPFSQSTRLSFELGRAGTAILGVFDVSGRQVRRWTLPGLSPGRNQVTWNGADEAGAPLASGVYHILVTDAAGSRASGQVIYLR
jgi:FlgD Ig-like domain